MHCSCSLLVIHTDQMEATRWPISGLIMLKHSRPEMWKSSIGGKISVLHRSTMLMHAQTHTHTHALIWPHDYLHYWLREASEVHQLWHLPPRDAFILTQRSLTCNGNTPALPWIGCVKKTEVNSWKELSSVELQPVGNHHHIFQFLNE